MLNTKPLDDLEIYELFRAAYPERFPDDNDETWEEIQEFADEISGYEAVAELLGRVAMLTMPMKSMLSNTYLHCLGTVAKENNSYVMTAAVRRGASDE